MANKTRLGRKSRNWDELPDDITALFLSRLGSIEILETAQWVYTKWHRICNNPNMWHTIHMVCPHDEDSETEEDKQDIMEAMCSHAFDLARGNIVDIGIQNFGSDRLLKHVTHSSKGIGSLSIVSVSEIMPQGLIDVASELPLLEELELSFCTERYSHDFIRSSFYDYSQSLRVIGHSCPLLKSLKLNKLYRFGDSGDNGEALAIAEAIPGLQNLEIWGNRLTQKGMQAIVQGCLRFESLDLGNCLRLYDRIYGDNSKLVIGSVKIPDRGFPLILQKALAILPFIVLKDDTTRILSTI